MFFTLSKVLSPALLPSHFALGMLVVGAALTFTRRARVGRTLTALGVALLLVFGALPTGALLLQPLEQRFARSTQTPDIIVVLGGGINPVRSAQLNRVVLNGAAERLTDTAVLSHRFPAARIVVTGCNSALIREEPCEAYWAKRFLVELGVTPERILEERRSRDTYENALYTRDLLAEQPEARLLVVTSAFHMPRSMGIFRKLGMTAEPWPVAYLENNFDFGDIVGGLGRADTAVREWMGLAAYYLAGRTSALFPAP